MRFKIWMWLDTQSHRYRPEGFNWICDGLDRSLGMYDDDE